MFFKKIKFKCEYCEKIHEVNYDYIYFLRVVKEKSFYCYKCKLNMNLTEKKLCTIKLY